MKLNVFRGLVKVGSLDILANEPFYGFTYNSEYLVSPSALPLSLSLPLTQSRYNGIEAQPYFEGLLPEGEARGAIARRLGISRRSSAKLLRNTFSFILFHPVLKYTHQGQEPEACQVLCLFAQFVCRFQDLK